MRILGALLLLCAISCERETPPAQPQAPHPRIVSLAPSLTEILFAVGAGPNVVGVTAYCNYPPAARECDVVGNVTINIEKVLSLKPDLIVAESSLNASAIRALQGHKTPVHVFTIRTLDDILRAIGEMGDVAGRRTEARAIVERLTAIVKTVRIRRRDGPHKRVIFEASADPIFVAGPGNYVDDLLKACGAENVAADLALSWGSIGPESYIRFDPDVILICHEDREIVEGRDWWKSLRAVREGNVRFLERDIFARPTVRLIENIERIDRMIHGEER